METSPGFSATLSYVHAQAQERGGLCMESPYPAIYLKYIWFKRRNVSLVVEHVRNVPRREVTYTFITASYRSQVSFVLSYLTIF